MITHEFGMLSQEARDWAEPRILYPESVFLDDTCVVMKEDGVIRLVVTCGPQLGTEWTASKDVPAGWRIAQLGMVPETADWGDWWTVANMTPCWDYMKQDRNLTHTYVVASDIETRHLDAIAAVSPPTFYDHTIKLQDQMLYYAVTELQ